MERWKINLYTLWVTQVFSLMGFSICIPFTPFFLQELGVTDITQLNYYVGLTYTLPAATMAVAAPIWGIASDRFGRKMMIMRAMLCAAVLLVLMGFVSDVWQFLLLRTLQGIFTGTVTASMGFVSANTPENRMSYALGLMTSSNFLGNSIGPVFGGVLAEFIGYRFCFGIGGALMATGFLLVVFLVKEDKNTYGYRIRSAGGTNEKYSDILEPFIIAILFTLLFQRVSRSVFLPFIPLFVQETLGTITGAATYTGIINGAVSLATAISALTITRLGDNHNKMKLSFILLTIAVPAAILFNTIQWLPLFVVFFTVYFFLAGGTEPILTSAVSERIPAGMRGALFGMVGTVGCIGAMIAPMMGSYISVEFGIRAILTVIPVFTLVQIACLYISQRTSQRLSAEKTENDEKAEQKKVV